MCQGKGVGTCKDKCGGPGAHAAPVPSNTGTGDRTYGGCKCKSNWTLSSSGVKYEGCPARQPFEHNTGRKCLDGDGCLPGGVCINGHCYNYPTTYGGLNFDVYPDRKPDGECTEEKEQDFKEGCRRYAKEKPYYMFSEKVDGTCCFYDNINLEFIDVPGTVTYREPILGPPDLRWCEVDQTQACEFTPQEPTWDYCIPKDTTQHQCQCLDEWSPDRDRCPTQSGHKYSGCGMRTACDGDNKGFPGLTWCKIDTLDTRCEAPGGRTWDYCVPGPQSQSLLANLAEAQVAITGVGASSIHGCQCKTAWNPKAVTKNITGSTCEDYESKVTSCAMDPPCDGDTGGKGWSWCEVEDPDLCAVPLPAENITAACDITDMFQYPGLGTEIKRIPFTFAWEQCCRFCGADVRCEGWTWYYKANLKNVCVLKNGTRDGVTFVRPPGSFASRVVSGFKPPTYAVSCKPHTDCPLGQFCDDRAGECQDTGSTMTKCSNFEPCFLDAEACVGFMCRLKCEVATDCPGIADCLTNDDGVKYCYEGVIEPLGGECGTPCNDRDLTCGADKYCMEGYCRTLCDETADCTGKQVCIPGGCAPTCANTDCPPGLFCGADNQCHLGLDCVNEPGKCRHYEGFQYEGDVVGTWQVDSVDQPEKFFNPKGWSINSYMFNKANATQRETTNCCDVCSNNAECIHWSYIRVGNLWTCVLHGSQATLTKVYAVGFDGIAESVAGDGRADCTRWTDGAGCGQFNVCFGGRTCLESFCATQCSGLGASCPTGQICDFESGMCRFKPGCRKMGQTCNETQYCADGLVCSSGSCYQECYADADCTHSYEETCVLDTNVFKPYTLQLGFTKGRCERVAKAVVGDATKTKRNWDYCVPPQLPEVDCFCDAGCLYNDDCCADFQVHCPQENKVL
jgi:hypothetical protein